MWLGTFVFYIKGRRTAAPSERTSQQDGNPAGQASRTPMHRHRTSRASTSPTPGSEPVAPHKGGTSAHTILLVEDNLVNQKVLGKQLRKAGNTVHVANHGKEALQFLEHTRLWKDNPAGQDLDLILMDHEMPVMNGLTAARRIRDLQGEGLLTKHIPIIAVTANARKEQIDTYLAAGMVCVQLLI